MDRERGKDSFHAQRILIQFASEPHYIRRRRFKKWIQHKKLSKRVYLCEYAGCFAAAIDVSTKEVPNGSCL